MNASLAGRAGRLGGGGDSAPPPLQAPGRQANDAEEIVRLRLAGDRRFGTLPAPAERLRGQPNRPVRGHIMQFPAPAAADDGLRSRSSGPREVTPPDIMSDHHPAHAMHGVEETQPTRTIRGVAAP